MTEEQKLDQIAAPLIEARLRTLAAGHRPHSITLPAEEAHSDWTAQERALGLSYHIVFRLARWHWKLSYEEILPALHDAMSTPPETPAGQRLERCRRLLLRLVFRGVYTPSWKYARNAHAQSRGRGICQEVSARTRQRGE